VDLELRRITSVRHSQSVRRHTRAGFSIIEALIAAAILLLVAIGVLPLFVRAMANNVSGSESTRVSNYSKSQIEELFQLPFGSAALTVTAGTESALPTQYWEDPNPTIDGDERWVTTTTAGRIVTWERIGTIRQYAVGAFDDGVLQPSEALPFGAATEFIHLKEIEVDVDARRAAGVLQQAQRMTVRTLKSQ
jgi:type II secretory pathway pseudopilin PulG